MNTKDFKHWAELKNCGVSVSTRCVDKDGKPINPSRYVTQELEPFVKEPWWKQVDWTMVSLAAAIVLALIAAIALVLYKPWTLGIIAGSFLITTLALAAR